MEATAEKSRTRWLGAMACAGLLAIFAVLSYSAARIKSPTSDEPLHAGAGYMIRWYGDYRVDTEDPALFPLLATILNGKADLSVDLKDPQFAAILQNHPAQSDFILPVLFPTLRAGEKIEASKPGIPSGIAYIDRARWVFLAIALMLGVLLTRWSYRLGGWPAAVLAAAFFSFDPNFIAHGPLVKNDVLLSLILLWLVYSIWLFGQRGTWSNAVSIVLACAAAVNVKFSGVLVAPLLCILLFVRCFLPGPWIIFKHNFKTRPARLALCLLFCITTALASWGGIWLVYRCRYSMSPDGMAVFDRSWFSFFATGNEMIAADPGHSYPTRQEVFSHPLSPTAAWVYWIDDHRLLPHAWSFGFLCTHITTVTRRAFLLGQYAQTGWWYYFPLAMLFKTPLATLALGVLLAGRWIQRKLTKSTPSTIEASVNWMSHWTACCIGVPIAVYGLMAMNTNINIGIRHVLPIYPFVYLLMATAAARWFGSGKLAVRVLILAAVISTAVETACAWPDYIPFFNIACGGERGGLELLGDSNIDWGQDLPLLAKWQQAHPDKRMYLAYFGMTDPAAYGIHYVNVIGGYPFSPQPVKEMDQPGVLAISATNLQGVYYPDDLRDKMEALRQRTPLAVLGGSIYLYDWTEADAASVRGVSGNRI